MAGVQESSMILQRLSFSRAELPADLGASVARERRARGWTQARLASKAKVSRATVYRVEGGTGVVLADSLFRIAHVLDVPIRNFVPTWPEWEPIKGQGHGEAVRERRRALGLTLAELAERIGVSEATLSRHERGIGVSPSFVRRDRDELVAVDNDRLAVALNPPPPAE